MVSDVCALCILLSKCARFLSAKQIHAIEMYQNSTEWSISIFSTQILYIEMQTSYRIRRNSWRFVVAWSNKSKR